MRVTAAMLSTALATFAVAPSVLAEPFDVANEAAKLFGQVATGSPQDGRPYRPDQQQNRVNPYANGAQPPPRQFQGLKQKQRLNAQGSGQGVKLKSKKKNKNKSKEIEISKDGIKLKSGSSEPEKPELDFTPADEVNMLGAVKVAIEHYYKNKDQKAFKAEFKKAFTDRTAEQEGSVKSKRFNQNLKMNKFKTKKRDTESDKPKSKKKKEEKEEKEEKAKRDEDSPFTIDTRDLPMGQIPTLQSRWAGPEAYAEPDAYPEAFASPDAEPEAEPEALANPWIDSYIQETLARRALARRRESVMLRRSVPDLRSEYLLRRMAEKDEDKDEEEDEDSKKEKAKKKAKQAAKKAKSKAKEVKDEAEDEVDEKTEDAKEGLSEFGKKLNEVLDKAKENKKKLDQKKKKGAEKGRKKMDSEKCKACKKCHQEALDPWCGMLSFCKDCE